MEYSSVEPGCDCLTVGQNSVGFYFGMRSGYGTQALSTWLHTQPSSFPSRDGPVSHFFPLKGNHWAQRRRADVHERWHIASQLETGILLAHSTAQDCHGETWSHGNKLPDKRKVAPYSAQTVCWP